MAGYLNNKFLKASRNFIKVGLFIISFVILYSISLVLLPVFILDLPEIIYVYFGIKIFLKS